MVSIALPYLSDHALEGQKTMCISFHYAAAPVGVALGIIIGYDIAEALVSWHLPLLLDAMTVALILFVGTFSYKDAKHTV